MSSWCSDLPKTPPPTSSEAASFSLQFAKAILHTHSSSKPHLSPHPVKFKLRPSIFKAKSLRKYAQLNGGFPDISIPLPKDNPILSPNATASCDYDSSSSFTTYPISTMSKDTSIADSDITINSSTSPQTALTVNS